MSIRRMARELGIHRETVSEIHRRRESADAAKAGNSSGATICYHRGLSKGHLWWPLGRTFILNFDSR